MPKRIQRSRAKGSKFPATAKYVGRGSKFGNPFRIIGAQEYLFCDASHRRTVFTPWVIFDQDQDIFNNPATPKMAVEMYSRWLDGEFNAAGIVRPCLITEEDLESLRGYDLGCWCSIEQEHCHANELLRRLA